MRHLFLLLCAMVLLPGRSLAFEGPEHKRLADLSYHVALKLFCSDKANAESEPCRAPGDRAANVRMFYDPVENGGDRTGARFVTYGDVVKCVDAFLSPEKLIAGQDKELIKPAGAPRPASLYPSSRDELNLEAGHRCSPSLLNAEGDRAGHVNHTHFQAELLVAQRSNHALALYLYAIERNLFGALTLNAISEHYLEDTYAPGHITAWRSKLSDVVANSYHDHQNRAGLEVEVDQPRLKAMASFKPTESGVDPFQAILDVISTGAAAEYFFVPAKCKVDCSFAGATDREQRLDSLKAAIKQPWIKFKGDNQLWDSSQDAQRFVMLVSSVRSLMDVLESVPATADKPMSLKDSFASNSWSWYYDEHPVTVTKATFQAPIDNSTVIAKAGAVTYKVERRYPREGGLDDQDSHLNRIDNSRMDGIWGVAFGQDAMVFGDVRSRWTLELERVINGVTPADKFGKEQAAFGNVGVTAGVQVFRGPNTNGAAVTGRLLWLIPETEMAWSLQGRYMRLKAAQHSEWHPSLGLRFDMGFTSFLTMYFRGSYDWAAQSNGRIQSGFSIGGGVQVGSPECRIFRCK